MRPRMPPPSKARSLRGPPRSMISRTDTRSSSRLACAPILAPRRAPGNRLTPATSRVTVPAMGDERPRVVVVSGHMVDAPDRPRERFPASQVERVAGEVRRAFDRWSVGPGTTVITSGARGADIIGAEQARARGAAVRLVLAGPPDEFERSSVALPGTHWATRFPSVPALAGG